MIKSEELRIGNLVYVPEFEIELTVSNLTKHELNFAYGVVQIEPIPLIKEWLEKNGKGNDIEPYCIGEFELYIDDDKSVLVYWNGKYLINIRYAHQLQNLHFILTTKELTIK